MKCVVSVVLSITIVLQCFLISTFAADGDEIFTYVRHNGEIIEYMVDDEGNKYIYENNEKVYIALPVQTTTVSGILVENFMQRSDIATESLPYSKIMNVGTGEFTDIIYLDDRSNIWLKCSNYSPSSAAKGMSYIFFYSYNGRDWVTETFVNETLSIKKKHYVYESGYPYFKVRMWSYTGAMSTCLLSIA